MFKKIHFNIYLIISILIAIIVIVGAIFLKKNSFSPNSSDNLDKDERLQYADNVSTEDNKQIIQITAKGGYSPEHSIAKAGVPTLLKFDTRGTLDCSSFVRIPSMNISQRLPVSDSTYIDIGTQKVGKLYGTCGMGMYPFDIEFN